MELDLSRAGVISLQRSLPNENTSWEVEYTIGSVHYQVTGNARHGRPHGSDNDVMLALQTLFLRAVCPEHGRIDTTASAILEVFTSHRGGSYYALLREALLRLAGTNWTMIQSTWDERTRRHQGETSTHSLFQLTLSDWAPGENRPFEGRELQAASRIRLKLDDALAASIRAGFFLILDAELLARLAHPNARNLYRVLQGHRVQANGSLAAVLQLQVGEWFKACGLEGERTDNARRLLAAAEQRLLAEGFLQSVRYTGRGRQGTVEYTFLGVPVPELVERLMAHRVSRPVAESLAADHPERIDPALRLVDARLAEGWKPRNLGASVVDAVRNPVKWGYVLPPTPVPASRSRRQALPASEPEDTASDPTELARALLRVKLNRALTPVEQEALAGLSSAGLTALTSALKQPAGEGVAQARAILGLLD